MKRGDILDPETTRLWGSYLLLLDWVLVADAYQQFRIDFRNTLHQEQEFMWVGECSSGLEIPRLCAQTQPDVVVMDLFIPPINSDAVIEQLQQDAPKTKILVLTDGDHALSLEAIRRGAAGCMLKESIISPVLNAIRFLASEVIIYIRF